MKKNKYVFKCKNIIIIIYATNIRWAKFDLMQFYYDLYTGDYDYYDIERPRKYKSKTYCIDGKFNENVSMRVNALNFSLARQKVEKLFDLLLDDNNKIEDILKVEVYKNE